MGRELARLTAVQVRSLGPGLHADGGGLFLHVQGGRRSWVFVWKRGGKQHRRGLGSVKARSLARARELAAELRAALADGRHPDEVLGRLAQGGAPIPTVAEAAERMIQDRAAAWRNPKHAQQWRHSLRDYAWPVVGAKRPAEVTLEDVLAILKPIWTTKTETATRVRQRLEAVLDYCAVHGWREESNPARW
ncbi:tyrosine-type recombinase/integrase, partial [Tepidimonas alkaliphilus]|uniref:tyrosine-type recombinase/integrase n=1 Tax=Tepidimonas alkaliphilus TaxID=2588942 RepID=UPI00163D9563